MPEETQEPQAGSCWRQYLWWPLAVGSGLLILTAILPLFSVSWWWVRFGDFPRVQLLFSYAIAVMPLQVFCRRRFERWKSSRMLVVLLLFGVGIQLYWILPYLPVAPYEVEPAQANDPAVRLKVLTANVLQSNRNPKPLLEQIGLEKPDVVVLCEVDQRWINDVADLDEQFSFQLKHPLENGYGIALYTSLEVVDARVRALVREDIPSIDAIVRLRSGHKVRLFALHPNPPRPGESTTKRDAELVLAGREVEGEQSVLVLGDLNDVGWSRTTNLFQEVSGLLDPRKGRGLYPTFDARSWFWRYPLDYLFHSDDFRVVEMQTLPDIGSDHFPLMVELSHEPDASASQEAPDLDAGDHEDADDAVEKAKESGEASATSEAAKTPESALNSDE